MLELKIRCGYSQAPVLQSVKVDLSTPPSPWDGLFAGEGGEEGSTLTFCSTGACEYPHLILSSSIFLSLSNASAKFRRDLKFYGPRCSLVSPKPIEFLFTYLFGADYWNNDLLSNWNRTMGRDVSSSGYTSCGLSPVQYRLWQRGTVIFITWFFSTRFTYVLENENFWVRYVALEQVSLVSRNCVP